MRGAPIAIDDRLKDKPRSEMTAKQIEYLARKAGVDPAIVEAWRSYLPLRTSTFKAITFAARRMRIV